MHKILIIQTAFIGDVILATPVIEYIKTEHPSAKIDFLLRKGNEPLFLNHPHVDNVITLDKSKNRILELWRIIKKVRQEKYSQVINLHRFASSGFITICSGAKQTSGFNKNPFSLFFNKTIKHEFGGAEKPIHEVERNLRLITNAMVLVKPKLYPDYSIVNAIGIETPYITISPASIWYTKKWPEKYWSEFINRVGHGTNIYLLGGPSDVELCQFISQNARSNTNLTILAGKLSLLESAAIMKNAQMNYVNDSAPLHLASAVNAPVTAIFCSTVKEFGFTPLSDNQVVLETEEELSCRPCGLHGMKACPQGHFKCSEIAIERLLQRLN